MNPKSLLRVMPVLFALLALVIVAGTVSSESEPADTKEQVTSEPGSDGLSAVAVAKDKDGGLRQPTKNEMKHLAAQVQKTLSKYKKHNPKFYDSGKISLVTAPHSVTLSVATVEDGKVKFRCTNLDEVQPSQVKAEEKTEAEE